MSVSSSWPTQRLLAAGWLVFATANVVLMCVMVGGETIPYHLIWASYALLYGLLPWSRTATWITFWGVTVATGLPLLLHAHSGAIDWAECSEIVLMGVIVGLLIWHVNRHRAAQRRIAELRQSEQVRAHNRELAARFSSHEIRTRLTVARGFTELIRDATIDDSIASDACSAVGELDKASALATVMLTLVRVETPSPQESVQLDELIAAVVGRWSATVGRQWKSSSSVGVIHGDAERIEAALDCLVENAVKFTSPTDTIEIGARLEAGDVVLSVADTGSGIPEADLDRIFQLFETGSTAGERAGSGLGLAIVTAIVSARDGSLSVASTFGEGSCFTMRMPAAGSQQYVQLPLTEATEARSTSQPSWQRDVLGVG